MKDLVIIGAGGFGREVAWLVEEINRRRPTWRLLGFIDEDEGKRGRTLNGYPVLGDFSAVGRLPQGLAAVCAVGDPAAKERLVGEAVKAGLTFVNLIHPNVAVSPWVELGVGVIVCEGVVMTTNIVIGNHVSINPGCGLGHDVTIKDYTTLLWHVDLGGGARVGRGCLLGTKATVLPGVTVGKGTVVGAGAVVTRDLPPRCTAVGLPAKPIKFHGEG